MWARIFWIRPICDRVISGAIDCLVMTLFVAMSAGVTWVIWH